MYNFEKESTELLHSTDELRKLILQNPSLPIVVFAGGEANPDDGGMMSCSYVNAYVGEFLDCSQKVNDERVYTDKDEFREAVADKHGDDFEGSDAEFDKYIDTICAEYEPYWVKCIILSVDN